MTKQITRISILQTSKVLAVLYVALGLLYVPVGLGFMIFGEGGMKIVGIFYVLMPIIMGVFGFLLVAIGALIYNLVAKVAGGVEFSVADVGSQA